MSEVRVACAMADRPAGAEVVQALRALGYAATLAPLTASRAAAQAAPAVVVWSRHAAAEPKLRALLRQGPAPLLARLDDAPTPPQTAPAIIDWGDRRAPAKLAGLLAAASSPIPDPVTPAIPALESPAAQAPIKGKAGGWIALGLILALAAGAAGAASWLGHF
jgi:hypothetical protein